MNQQTDFFRWAPPEELETRFGVELETCIRTIPSCINFDTELLNAIPNMKLKDKFDYYYKNIIIKSKYFNKLADEYRYVLLVDNGINYYYDMLHPTTEGLSLNDLRKMKLDEEGLNENGIDNEDKRFLIESSLTHMLENGKNYGLPMFVDDLSIRCGDTDDQSEKNQASITDNNSFRFECITPILSVKGYPTKEKIKQKLLPFLSLFGLEHPNCFIENFSMGFHVNVSLYHTGRQKFVAIAEEPFLNDLLRNYIKVEKNIYKTVRTRKPLNAPLNYISKFARPLYGNLEQFKKTHPQLTEGQIIDLIMTNKEYINEKYKALKRKSPFLLEFRLFESDADINRLINYVFVTLDIVHKTANEVAKKSRLALTNNRLNNNNGNVDNNGSYRNNNGNSNNNRYNNNNYGGGLKKYKKTLKRARKLARKTRKNKYARV